MIDPRDVIRQYTVEELCETADEYYRRVPDPTPLMSKPFSFLHETPEMLQNLGLLLAGLRLGKTMTILDFGGGTGWLARLLTQLNCQVVCADPSRAALAIGERLFNEYPLIGTAVFRPAFLWFDGRRIDLNDQSMDRVICFDAFHHVPNARTVLGEFARVLKPGGIAGFSEPGRQHSQTPQSQYEMRNHRVLENDIDLNDIFAMAKDAGFTRLSVKVVNDNMDMSLQDYGTLFQGRSDEDSERLRARIWNETYNGMFNRSIFFLHKGEYRPDSRSHIGLAHRLSVMDWSRVVEQGRSLLITVRLENSGEAAWLDKNAEIFGIVRLGSHLYGEDGKLLAVDFSRHDLPRRVEPGDSLEMTVEVSLPAAGRYKLGFDLVAEGVTWFENVGSRPVEIAVDQR